MTEGTNGIVTTMPVAPATAANPYANNDMMGGMGSWIWILIIFMLMGGNRGFGFGNSDSAVATPTAGLLNNEFLYTQQKIDNLGQELVRQTMNLTQTMNNGFNAVNVGLCNLNHQLDIGFCGVNRNVDQSRFEAAQNTCTITTAINASTQAIRDLINTNTMQDLRDRNGELSNALNNSVQTQNIVNQLRPYPAPAYITAPPGLPFGAVPGSVPFGNPCNPCNPCNY